MAKTGSLCVMGLAITAAAVAEEPAPNAWRIQTPIVTWYAGPDLTEAAVQQMAEGGYNLIWCKPEDLDLLHASGLRGMLRDEALFSPRTLDDPARMRQLDAVIEQVKGHPAMYSYYITDEPSAAQFPALGRLVAYLNERDPRHMAYINLLPTYSRNEYLGTTGDTITAYQEHLRQFIETVRPRMLSYDHYQFYVEKDGDEYFLNLDLVRQAAEQAGVPFLNIVQASAWEPTVRVPGEGELRYLVYTTLGYGAQGISYYVYYYRNHEGCVVNADGTPTPIYHILKRLNPEFVAIATELQSLKTKGIYHTSLAERGCRPVPDDAAVKIRVRGQQQPSRGAMLSYFGPADGEISHVMICNLDYRSEATMDVVRGGVWWDRFDAGRQAWSLKQKIASLRLAPGGGVLLRRCAAP